MSKHTKEPWLVEKQEDGFYCVISRGITFKTVICRDIRKLADAQLISAAPVLKTAANYGKEAWDNTPTQAVEALPEKGRHAFREMYMLANVALNQLQEGDPDQDISDPY